MLKIFRKLALITLISLSGCQSVSVNPESPPFEGRYWVNPSSYYGEGYVFDLVDDPDLETKEVFVVNNEMELALLTTLFYDQGVYEVYYFETQVLDMNKVMMYAYALSPYDIWWEDFEITVNDDLTIYSAQFDYDFEEIASVNQNIDEWNQLINSSDFSNDEKVQFVYDTLLEKVSYDDEVGLSILRDEPAFSAVGALEEGKAVCHGYSLAFLGLLKDLDIPSLVVSSEVDDHAWNLVYTEGKWTYFDATWEDDTNDADYYYYYALSQEEIEQDHVFDEHSDNTLSSQDYLDLAYYVFPETQIK